MALYKVNRRIVMGGKAYNPGVEGENEIELTDKQAAQMKNGQVTLMLESTTPPTQAPVAAKPTLPVPSKSANPQSPTKSTRKQPDLPGKFATIKASLDAAEETLSEVSTEVGTPTTEPGATENTAPAE
jgi:hypothetical protein